MSEPAQREGFPTVAAIERIAARFGISLPSECQDWAICAADHERIDEFLHAYESEPFTPDEQVVVMEMLLQSFEDAELSPSDDARWGRLAALLRRDSEVHVSIIRYWRSIKDRPEEQWRVPALVRAL